MNKIYPIKLLNRYNIQLSCYNIFMNKKSTALMVGAMCFAIFLCGAVVATVLNAQNQSLTPPSSFVPPIFSFQKVKDLSTTVIFWNWCQLTFFRFPGKSLYYDFVDNNLTALPV